MKKSSIYLIILVLIVVVTGCAKKEQEVAPVEKPLVVQEEEKPEPPPAPEEEKLPFIAPLTGIRSEKEIDNRVFLVMFGNNPEARPQSGLNKADIVFEILAEGSITRLVGFFQSSVPEVIGPVRSIRSYFVDLAQGLDAVMVHAGRSNEAHALIETKGYDDMDEIYNAGYAFWRESFRKAPNNVYTNLTKLNEAMEKKKIRTDSETVPLLFKDEDAEATGSEAKDVMIAYSSRYNVGYQYDEEKKIYKRNVYDDPHTDLTTGETLTATNIIVAKAPHKILDNVGHLDVEINGPGKGWYLARGKAIEVEWVRKDGMIRVYSNNQEVPMYPGQTWVHIIPTVGSTVEYK